MSNTIKSEERKNIRKKKLNKFNVQSSCNSQEIRLGRGKLCNVKIILVFIFRFFFEFLRVYLCILCFNEHNLKAALYKCIYIYIQIYFIFVRFLDEVCVLLLFFFLAMIVNISCHFGASNIIYTWKYSVAFHLLYITYICGDHVLLCVDVFWTFWTPKNTHLTDREKYRMREG